MSVIANMLDARLVHFFDAASREDALKILVSHLQGCDYVQNAQGFLQAVLQREKLVSTGIGMGVAIPHAKMIDYEKFFLAIGILQTGIDWEAQDGTPVRLIFLIGGPDDRQNEYLQILSRLTFALKDEVRRRKMLQLQTPQDIISLFNNI